MLLPHFPGSALPTPDAEFLRSWWRDGDAGPWAHRPSFAVSDVPHVRAALGPERARLAYPWAALAEAGARLLAGTDYPIEVLEPLAGLARLVSGRSDRDGFRTPDIAPPHSRLAPGDAFRVMSDERAGHTVLSADPRAVPAGEIDRIEVLGTSPVPF